LSKRKSPAKSSGAFRALSRAALPVVVDVGIIVRNSTIILRVIGTVRHTDETVWSTGGISDISVMKRPDCDEIEPQDGPHLAGTWPAAHISERRISMTESEWARRTAQQFKSGKARKAKEDAKLQHDQRIRAEYASGFWANVKGAFKAKAEMFNAAVGQQVLTWEAGDANTFSLSRKDIEGCVKGSYQEAPNQINIEVLGRLVPLHVAPGHRTGKYCLFGADEKPYDTDSLAETLIEEFLKKH
jgi:hypothetical protein